MERVVTALEQINRKQSEELMQMALQMRSLVEIVNKLEKEVRRLEKLTSMQVTELNACIRKHGRELCETYGLEGKEAKVNTFIRQALRQEFGISAVKELCKSDFMIAKNVIEMYEDTERLFRLRKE